MAFSLKTPGLRVRVQLLGSVLALVGMVAGGCAHSEKAVRVDTVRRAFTAEPPPFMKGPGSLLLTNADGYAAHAVLERGAASEKTNSLSGELLVRGGKLFFAVESNGAKSGRSAVGAVSFVWDTTANGGFVLSDALQGYAPISSNLKFTNVTVVSSPPGASGSRADPAGVNQEATIAVNDGSLASFRVWRSSKPAGLPVRIESISGGTPFTLTLSKVQAVAPTPGLFEPPSDFTKYETAESMMYEIVTRQQNARRRSYEPSAADLEGQPTSRPPARY